MGAASNKSKAKKAQKPKPTSAALVWGLDAGTPKGDAVRALLKEAGAVVRTVRPERLGDSAGAALGLAGMRPALMPYTGPVPECEFLLLCNFTEAQLNGFLAKSRQAGAVVGCKAVLTKTNKDWRVVDLINEVAAEHATMQAQGQTQPPAEPAGPEAGEGR